MSGQPSLAGGGDYAFGGARVATDGAGLPPSLLAQQGMFLQSVGNVAPSTALYVIAGGGNDARDALAAAAGSMNPFADIAAAARAYAQATASLVDQLQAAGAQQIVVWDVPDIGLTPAVMDAGGGASFLGTAVSRAMNRALARSSTARRAFRSSTSSVCRTTSSPIPRASASSTSPTHAARRAHSAIPRPRSSGTASIRPRPPMR
jgi:phospholipase/lecithinase/hemolysin